MSAVSPVVGEILTAAPGTWSGNPTFSYQWMFSTNGTVWTNITGATSNSFTIISAQLNGYICCAVTGFNEHGQLTDLSTPTGLVTASATTLTVSNLVVTSSGSTVTASVNYSSDLATVYLNADSNTIQEGLGTKSNGTATWTITNLSAGTHTFTCQGYNSTGTASNQLTSGPVVVSSAGASNLLKYSPPAQTSPTIVNVGTGHFSATYSSTQDVTLVMPASVNTGGIQISGGRNIRIIGGYIRNTGGGSTIRMGGVTGSIYIEGLLMDGTGTTATDPDCLNLSGSTSTDVYVQNCRATGYHGYHDSAAQHHSDLYQPQGPSRNIYIDVYTGDTSYQGFFVSPNLSVPQNITSLTMSRVNLSHNTVEPNGTVTNSSLIWLLDSYPGQTPYPSSFDQVYVKPRSGQTAISEEVYPASGIATVGAITTGDGGITWPSVMKVTGEINPGGLSVPAAGDFAPAGNTVSGSASSSPGLNYVSPGYQ